MDVLGFAIPNLNREDFKMKLALLVSAFAVLCCNSAQAKDTYYVTSYGTAVFVCGVGNVSHVYGDRGEKLYYCTSH